MRQVLQNPKQKLRDAIIDECIQLQSALEQGQQNTATEILVWVYRQIGIWNRQYSERIEHDAVKWYIITLLYPLRQFDTPPGMSFKEIAAAVVAEIILVNKLTERANQWLIRYSAHKYDPCPELAAIRKEHEDLKQIQKSLRSQLNTDDPYVNLAMETIKANEVELSRLSAEINRLEKALPRLRDELPENLARELGTILAAVTSWDLFDEMSPLYELRRLEEQAIWPVEEQSNPHASDSVTQYMPRVSRCRQDIMASQHNAHI